MLVCQLIVAIVGDTVGFNHTHTDAAGTIVANNTSAVNAQIAFICIYIFFFASTWGPGAWIVIGEIFPLPIRARGVGLSTASNWLWNTVSCFLIAPVSLLYADRIIRSFLLSRHIWLVLINETFALTSS
jgi:hypothetical protein